LHHLYPYVSAASRTVNSLNKELDKIQKTLKKISDVPEEISQQVKAMEKELEQIKIELTGDPDLGYRGRRFSVQGGLFMLGEAIGSYTAAPTDRQIQQIQEKKDELSGLIQRINKMIEEGIPGLNKLLNANNIPHMLTGKTIKFDLQPGS
jgi:prefoldin subunit 5